MSQQQQQQQAENGVSCQGKVLSLDTMNPNVKRVEYAVRGPIVQRAVQLEKELREVGRSERVNECTPTPVSFLGPHHLLARARYASVVLSATLPEKEKSGAWTANCHQEVTLSVFADCGGCGRRFRTARVESGRTLGATAGPRAFIQTAPPLPRGLHSHPTQRTTKQTKNLTAFHPSLNDRLPSTCTSAASPL